MRWLSCIWLCLPSAAALRVSKPPVVAGTQQLVPRELTGATPVFVDAFLDADGSQATVILSLSPLYTKGVTTPEQRKWSGASWVCSWTCPSQLSFAKSRGVMLGNPEAPRNSPVPSEAWHRENGTHKEFGASEIARQFTWAHHSLVVGCPVPLPSHCPDLVLDVTATHQNVELYSRRGVKVQNGAFVRKGKELILCTMYDGVHGRELIWPWAKYHLAVGFQQILIYIESPTDTTSALLQDLVASGHVTVVPFYFGSISNQDNFYMQAAMEQHCLFQARHRAQWVGHNDVDEFFELSAATGMKDIKQFLWALPQNTPAVVAESQFWQLGSRSGSATAPFPCGITCKHQGYLGTDARTKWIARPTMVELWNPHHVESDFPVLELNPRYTLRVNHFRHCARDGSGCDPHVDSCTEDTSFLPLCSAALNATLPP